MEKEDFLLKLAREELADDQIRREFNQHYGIGRLAQAKWDLKAKTPCCMTAALAACEKLTNIAKSPCLGA